MKKKLLSAILTVLIFSSTVTVPVSAMSDDPRKPDENVTVIELNSGAERNGDFVSVNQIFVTDNGAYRLIMTGLKEDNKNAVLEAFMAYFDPQNEKVLKLTDPSFADAEKWDNEPIIYDYEFDAAQCWQLRLPICCGSPAGQRDLPIQKQDEP